MKHLEGKVAYQVVFHLAPGSEPTGLLASLANHAAQLIADEPSLVFVDGEEADDGGGVQLNLLVDTAGAAADRFRSLFDGGRFDDFAHWTCVERVADSAGRELYRRRRLRLVR